MGHLEPDVPGFQFRKRATLDYVRVLFDSAADVTLDEQALRQGLPHGRSLRGSQFRQRKQTPRDGRGRSRADHAPIFRDAQPQGGFSQAVGRLRILEQPGTQRGRFDPPALAPESVGLRNRRHGTAAGRQGHVAGKRRVLPFGRGPVGLQRGTGRQGEAPVGRLRQIET